MEHVSYLVKGFLNIVLPVVDLATDINFTVEMYLKNDNFSSVKLFKDCYGAKYNSIGCLFMLSGTNNFVINKICCLKNHKIIIKDISVIMMLLPLLTNLMQVITSVEKRWNLKEYVISILNQGI